MTGPKGFKYGVDVRLDNYEREMFDGVVVCAGVQVARAGAGGRSSATASTSTR